MWTLSVGNATYAVNAVNQNKKTRTRIASPSSASLLPYAELNHSTT
jgi:hypothetical protein